MGYYIVNFEHDSDFTYYYVKDIREVANLSDINSSTIIFEGLESQVPELLIMHPEFKKYSELNFRLGIRAEDLFKEQAIEKKFIVTDINQSLEDFVQYRTLNKWVKRSDFLIRNANLEVEVKCRTIKNDKDNKEFFYFPVYDVEKHLNWMEFSYMPIIVAVYARKENSPDPEKLFMIEIQKIQEHSKNLAVNSTFDFPHYQIPLSLTEPGFTLIEQFRRDVKARLKYFK